MIAISWYEEISSDVAIRLAKGQSHRIHGRKLTPEMFAEMQKVMESPNFYKIESLVKKYRVNKYEIYKAIAKEKNMGENASGEALVINKADEGLKKAYDWTTKCEGCNCLNCVYDKVMFGEYTLCEILCALEFEGKTLVSTDNIGLQKIAENCKRIKLEGKTKIRGFEIYESVLQEFDKLAKENAGTKKRDLVSRVLLDGIRKRRRA
jgi:hypothetical protein